MRVARDKNTERGMVGIADMATTITDKAGSFLS